MRYASDLKRAAAYCDPSHFGLARREISPAIFSPNALGDYVKRLEYMRPEPAVVDALLGRQRRRSASWVFSTALALAWGCSHRGATTNDTDSGTVVSGHDAGDAQTDARWPDGGHTDCPGPYLCQRDPFIPPFPVSGVPGWQNSTGEVCSARGGQLRTGGVRANSRGVFALIGTELDAENFFTSASPGWQLLLNDGSNWSSVIEFEGGNGIPSGVTQFEIGPDGTVILVRAASTSGTPQCGILALDTGGGTQCLSPDFDFRRVAFAPDGRLYALSAHEVFVFSGGSWTSLFVAPQGAGTLLDLWTDGTTTLAVGSAQTVVRFVAGGSPELLLNTPAGNYVKVEATSPANVFIGTQTGQIVRLIGPGFSLVETGLPVCYLGGPITGLWISSSGDMYGSAARGIVKLSTSGAIEVLAQWPCEIDVSVLDVSGDDARGEQYFALRNGVETYRTCGESHLVVRDTSGFRLF